MTLTTQKQKIGNSSWKYCLYCDFSTRSVKDMRFHLRDCHHIDTKKNQTILLGYSYINNPIKQLIPVRKSEPNYYASPHECQLWFVCCPCGWYWDNLACLVQHVKAKKCSWDRDDACDAMEAARRQYLGYTGERMPLLVVGGFV